MITIAEFIPEDVFKYVPEKVDKKNDKIKQPFQTSKGVFNVNVGSKRLIIFKKNPSCICCGITGTVILLQCSDKMENPHFNFYAKDENDELVLMTKDHLKPSSQGGSNRIRNLQTMCFNCNGLKGNYLLTNEQLVEARKLYLSLLKDGMTHKKAFHKMERFKKQLCEHDEVITRRDGD